jgi:hypothetical protein
MNKNQDHECLFKKKVENHEHSVAVHYMYYNFGRIHQSLRVTPAMEGGLTDHFCHSLHSSALPGAVFGRGEILASL